MERTGKTQLQLQTLTGIDQGTLSRILMGSRRCSLENALRLTETTGVPVENLVQWPRRARPALSEQPVKTDQQKQA